MNYTFTLLFFLSIFMIGCEEKESYSILSDKDLDAHLANEYIKINYSIDNLDLKKCNDLEFKFEDVEVVKISKSDFLTIKEGLNKSKLNPLQLTNDADFMAEYNGKKYCMNHLGQMYRNTRKLVDNADLVYLIKSKSNYYNHFTEEDLMAKDTLINRFGVGFGFSYIDPETSGNLLENDSLVVEKINHKTNYNIVLTY